MARDRSEGRRTQQFLHGLPKMSRKPRQISGLESAGSEEVRRSKAIATFEPASNALPAEKQNWSEEVRRSKAIATRHRGELRVPFHESEEVRRSKAIATVGCQLQRTEFNLSEEVRRSKAIATDRS